MSREEAFRSQVRKVYRLLTIIMVMAFAVGSGLVLIATNPGLLRFESEPEGMVEIPVEVDEDRIENGVHVMTGLVEADGLMEVVNNCTSCHSAKIIIQNRMNTERWNATIKWMQETQNLWDLGKNQEIIVNYLVTNYPPKAKGRRMALTDIEWYDLED